MICSTETRNAPCSRKSTARQSCTPTRNSAEWTALRVSTRNTPAMTATAAMTAKTAIWIISASPGGDVLVGGTGRGWVGGRHVARRLGAAGGGRSLEDLGALWRTLRTRRLLKACGARRAPLLGSRRTAPGSGRCRTLRLAQLGPGAGEPLLQDPEVADVLAGGEVLLRRTPLERGVGEQHVLGEDEGVPGIRRQAVGVRHDEGLGGAGLDAEPAEDAPQVVDLVDLGVALPRRVPGLGGVLRSDDEDGVGWAGPGAQLAADALLEAVLVAVEDVAALEPGERLPALLRVLDRDGPAPQVAQGDPQPLGHVGGGPQRPEVLLRGAFVGHQTLPAIARPDTTSQVRAAGISTLQPTAMSLS